MTTIALARTTLFATTALLAALSAVPAAAERANPHPSAAPGPGHLVRVHGVDMYYEVHGSGRPLVLLHGAFSNIDTDFGKLLPLLSRTRKVIAIEQQGHGRTRDVARPLGYEQMADDTAELLHQLEVTNADFFGYSMGGAVALHVAERHPELVGKIVFAGGTAFRPEGFYPELLAGIANLEPEHLAGSPWQLAYAKLAPKPARWPALVAKVKALDLTWKGWAPERLKAIKAPALLIIGDSDIVRPEHTVEMFRLLGGGVSGDLHGLPRSQLAVLPGTTHVSLVDKVDWLASMMLAFLEAAPRAAS